MLSPICCRPCRFFITFVHDIQLIPNSTKVSCTRFRNIRSFQSGLPDVVEGQKKTALQENGWEPWSSPYGQKAARADPGRNKNIIVDDLIATLEAHRTANRIHKIAVRNNTEEPKDFYRLCLPKQPSQDGQPCHNEAAALHARTGKTESTVSRVPVSDIKDDSKSSSQELGDMRRTKRSKFEHQEFILKLRSRRKSTAKLHSFVHKENLPPWLHLEEQGTNLFPQGRWRFASRFYRQDTQSPWLRFLERPDIYGPDRLSQEITAYEKYMRLTVDEVEGLQEIRESVKAIADKAVPFARIELIGSHSIDLATPTSDMDFRLSLPMYEKDPFERGPSPGRPRARKAAMQQLKSLCQAFAASDAFTDATVLNAIVPIVKAVHVRTNIAIEIQVSSSEIPQQLYKKTYLAEYPTLRPLYILLRSALETRCLGTVFEGGLGSYTIFIMIVYALKTCPPNIDRTDVGGQLLYLLDFYANANLTKEGFSLDPPSAFPKLLKGQRRARIEGRSDAVSRGIQRIGNTDPLMPHRLCLQDPADPQNDLGRKSYCIMDVQKLFRYALKGILRNRQGANTESNRPGVLFPLVGANYDDFQRKRASLPGFRVLRVPGVSKTRPKDWI